MSDIRRRRKQSGGSDDLSDSYDELNTTKGTQSSEKTDGHRDSEYDTAGSDGESDGDSQDGGERESGDGQEEDKPQKKLDDDEDRRNPQYIPKRGTFYEHDDRTAEEASETATEAPPEREIKEKKVWKDKEDKWNHDRYNDDEQAPKSHEELIAVYGYDIRNEEGPPRARRRRRYGRGPNKYTRNWEDEDAYGKSGPNVPAGKPTGRKINKTGEQFPALGGVDKDATTEAVEEPVITSAWYSNKNKTPMKQQNFPPLQPQQDNNQKLKSSSSNITQTNENRAPNEAPNTAWKKDAKCPTRNPSPNRNVVGGISPEMDKGMNVKPLMRDTKDAIKGKRQVQESVSLAASKSRGRGFKTSPNNSVVGKIIDSKPKGHGAGIITVEAKRNNMASLHEDEHQHLANDRKHMSPNDAAYHPRQTKNFYVQSPGQQRPNAVPPRMQQHPQHHQQQHQPQQQQQQQQQQQPQQHQPMQVPDQQTQQIHPQPPDVAGNRPKRYSSLRQRPAIPEGPVQQQPPQYPPQHPQHGFYPPQGFPQPHYEQPPPVGNTTAPMTGQPVMPLAPGGQPASYAPPAFLVPPPQFIPPQPAPNIINYVPTPAGAPFQPNFQGYQGYNPAVQPQVPPPPPELFQPQGCTYYSPAQQQPPQGAPIRRPKAAIPILPPPETNSQYHQHQTCRGRGKTTQHGNPGVPGNLPLSSLQMQQNPEHNVTAQDSPSVLDNKLTPEAYEIPQYDQTSEISPEQEKIEPLPEPEPDVTTEVELCPVTNDPVVELVSNDDATPPNNLNETQTLPEPPTEISSETIVEKDHLEETPKESEVIEPPVVDSCDESVPSTLVDATVDETEVTKGESSNVLPGKPVVEEAAA